MLIFFFTLVCLYGHAKDSSFDLSGGIQGRSLPAFGAELYLDGGYNQLLWGERNNSKDIMFGLVRPSIGISTSGVINTVKAEIEFFPISFIGLLAGRQYLRSNFDFPFFDCEAVSCKGNFERNYVEGKMVIGAGGWIAMGAYRVDNMSSNESHRPLADWRHVIIGQPGEDVQVEKKLLFGKTFSENLLGVLLENVKFLGSGERKESFMGIYQISKKSSSYMIGAGLFHSDRQGMGFQMYFRINNFFLPNTKLF